MASSAISSNNSMNMLAMVFANWQRPDGTFPPVEPIYRMVWGPPGCSIVLHVAWRVNAPDGSLLHYAGFARVYRIFNTGQRDYRLFNFEARPCALCHRMHWDCNVGFRGGDDGDGHYGGGVRDICPFDVGAGGGGRGHGLGEEREDEDTADSAARNVGRDGGGGGNRGGDVGRDGGNRGGGGGDGQ